MRAEDFRGSPTGRLERTLRGQWAFVAAPLPRQLELSPELTLLLDEASRAVAYLAGVGETLPNPLLLMRPFLRREAVLSSRIEGTQATLRDVYLFEASGSERDRGDAREVLNYVRAVERGQQLLESLPICGRLVNAMHGVLMEGVRGGDRRPGRWREDQVWIGPAGVAIEEARFVPAPPTRVPDLMAEWERFANETRALPPLVATALLHYQFEAIHPYLDGNGRIGRALITLFLMQRKVLRAPLLYLSAYLERERASYYDHLYRVSSAGDWASWLRFFLTGVREQAEDASIRVRAVRDLYELKRRQLQEKGETSNALRLIDELFASPYLTVAQAQARLGLTNAGARRLLERLARAGVLEEVREARPRYYVARDLFALFEGRVPAAANG